jgi:hypothetical protein
VAKKRNDPTANVVAILKAAVERQDDLRELESRYFHELLEARSEAGAIRETCAREVADLRERHIQEMRSAEAARIDAIRSVDVQAVAAASEVAATQATTLAAQVATSAETLRTQVQAAATAQTVALGAALEPIQKDVADLRRVQYEQAGQRAGVTETTGERRASAGMVLAVAAGVSGFISLIVGVIVAIVAIT